jgi:hypothetical protein
MDRTRSSVHGHDELVGAEVGDRATVVAQDPYVHRDHVYRRTKRGRLLQGGGGFYVGEHCDGDEPRPVHGSPS